MPGALLGYVGRAVLGIGLALVLGVVGVALARMGLLLFGFTSWSAWITLLVLGAGGGAGIGSVAAWLGLKGAGAAFTTALALLAWGAGMAGGWFGFSYGAGVEPECCASPTMGPIAYTVLGAVVGSNLVAILLGVIGQTVLRGLRRSPGGAGASRSYAD